MGLGFGNLDFSCDTCETDWFLGSPGACDPINKTCICPGGYSGKDDFVITATCHVNEDRTKLFHTFCFIGAVIGWFITLACFVYLVLKYKVRSPHQRSKEKELRVLTICQTLSTLLFLLFFAIVYGTLALKKGKQSFVEHRNSLPILMGCGQIFVAITIVLQFYVSLRSLPDPEVYGSILEYPSFIVTHWKKINLFFGLGGVVWIVVVFVCFIILPLSENDEDFMVVSTYILTISTFIAALFLFIIAILATTSLLKLYERGVKLATQRVSSTGTSGSIIYNPLSQQEVRLKSLVRTLKIQQRVSFFCLALTIGFLLANIIAGGLYQYFFISGSVFVVISTSFVFPISTARWASGGFRLQN